MRRTLTAMVVALLLAGCASTGGPMSTPNPPASSPGTPASGPAAPGDVPEARWSAILADLSGRGVATDGVQLVSAREVTWNDGSLGCPQKGQSYTQALVAGMQVIVNAGGTEYDYRFGMSDHPKLCQHAIKARGIRLR